MSIALKRVYEKEDSADGYRVLVDRLWPHGIAKKNAHLDEWLKVVAPSDQLRKSYHDHALRWGEFRKRYLVELKEHRGELQGLVKKSAQGRVTLLFGSRDVEHNNAVVLRQYLKMLGTE